MFDGDPNLQKMGEKFATSPKTGSRKTSKFGPNFGQLRNLIANISRTKKDIECKTVL